MEGWELTARESIRDLVIRYNANGDSGRFAQVLELFVEHAVFDVPGTRCEGRHQISQMLTDTQSMIKNIDSGAQSRYLRHYTATHQIDVLDEGHAKGRCYYSVLMPHGLDHWGRYTDDYECSNGRWLFSYRKVTVDGYVAGGMGAAGVGAAAVALSGKG